MILREELKQLRRNTKQDARRLYEKAKEHPLIYLFFIITIIIMILLLVVLPYLQVNLHGINNATEMATLENQYRVTLAQIFGGGAVLLGLYFAWGNLRTASEGQITERFTRAVDQLGNENLAIRLGGIYALERISTESDKDYWPIMEILAYYIRSNSPVKYIDVVNAEEMMNKFEEYLDTEFKPSYDIRAILNVIKRRKHFFNVGESNSLELRETYLRQVNLSEAHLEKAYLYHSDLIGAHLKGAHLEGAYFGTAYLNWAYCDGAHLEGADLEGAHLEEACLKGAHLEEACLKGAHLEGAHLEEACLKGAKNLTIDQLSKVKTLYNATFDEELRSSLKEKYPEKYQALTNKPEYSMRHICR